MKKFKEISKNKWDDLVRAIPGIGDKLAGSLSLYDRNYYTDQNERIYRVSNKEQKGLLKVSQLRMLVQSDICGDKIGPITIRWNHGGNHDIYSVMFFMNPKIIKILKKSTLA